MAGGKEYYPCPKCDGDPFGLIEERRMDYQDMLAEMKTGDIDDGYSN
jgi:hypothetical protein